MTPTKSQRITAQEASVKIKAAEARGMAFIRGIPMYAGRKMYITMATQAPNKGDLYIVQLPGRDPWIRWQVDQVVGEGGGLAAFHSLADAIEYIEFKREQEA